MAWSDAARQAAAEARAHHGNKGYNRTRSTRNGVHVSYGFPGETSPRQARLAKGMTPRQKAVMKATALHLLTKKY